MAMMNVGIAASCEPMVITNRPRSIATLITVNTTNAAGNEGGVGVVLVGLGWGVEEGGVVRSSVAALSSGACRLMSFVIVGWGPFPVCVPRRE